MKPPVTIAQPKLGPGPDLGYGKQIGDIFKKKPKKPPGPINSLAVKMS